MNNEKNKAPKKIEYATTSNFTDNESFSAVETFVLESNNKEQEEPPYVGQIVNTAHMFKLLDYSLNKIINSNNCNYDRVKLNKQMNSYEVEIFLYFKNINKT
jgi:hypothetical protein